MTDYSQIPDRQLLILASEGECRAEDELIGRYMQTVRACARPFFLIGGEAEDLTQEGMLGLLSAIREYDGEKNASFSAYAQQCIRNRILSAIRSASRLKHSPLNGSLSLEQLSEDMSLPFAAIPESFQPSPEELVLAKESTEELYNALSDRLSRFEDKVLRYYLKGFSYSEIALWLGKEPKAVDNAVQRIRHKIVRDPKTGDFSLC